jgi:hypothetical protein
MKIIETKLPKHFSSLTKYDIYQENKLFKKLSKAGNNFHLIKELE